MSRLPRVSGREAASTFERVGFVIRRRRGSHIVMTKTGHPETLSVPDHRELQAGNAPGPDSEGRHDRRAL